MEERAVTKLMDTFVTVRWDMVDCGAKQVGRPKLCMQSEALDPAAINYGLCSLEFQI